MKNSVCVIITGVVVVIAIILILHYRNKKCDDKSKELSMGNIQMSANHVSQKWVLIDPTYMQTVDPFIISPAGQINTVAHSGDTNIPLQIQMNGWPSSSGRGTISQNNSASFPISWKEYSDSVYSLYVVVPPNNEKQVYVLQKYA